MMMSMSIKLRGKLGIKRVVGFVFITWMLMCTNTLYGQIITVCEHKAEADVNVYYTKWKHEADIVVMVVHSKYQAWFGKWYIDRSDGIKIGGGGTMWCGLKIYETRFKHDADYIVYVTKFAHEVSVTEEYIKACH